MRREYVETISSHAAPSPARHLLTSSAPSPTLTAVATPTSRPFKSLRGLGLKRPAWVVNPLSNGHYDRLKRKVPAAPRARGRPFSALRCAPERASDPPRRLRPRCDYYSRTMLHYILWLTTREVKSVHK